LVAIWTGDSGADSVTAVPNNGFTIIGSELLASCQVEAVVATKDVASAGTYNVTWTATPTQGTHMWLVAVQQRGPLLHVQASGKNVTVSWPTSSVAYSLEMTSNLLQGNVWQPVTNAPSIVGIQNMITNTITPGSAFYRLKN
jgi:hypothetical protein